VYFKPKNPQAVFEATVKTLASRLAKAIRSKTSSNIRKEQSRKMDKIGAIISVSWGDCVEVSITLSPKEWAAVVAGNPFSTYGDGYEYEGESFQDHWHLGGGLDGSLEVTYDDGGQGFVGSLKDADIGEHSVRRPKKKRKGT
jgi:hypothetical protein